MNDRLSRDDMIYQFVNHDTMALIVSVSTRLYILERQPTSTWHSMAMTESSLTDWLPCGLMMYNIVQLLLLLQKYIG